MDDGWTTWWRWWFAERTCGNPSGDSKRLSRIREVVWAAVSRLPHAERQVIESYYYEGLSLGRIGVIHGISKDRAVFLHRQALADLRVMLAGFAAEIYGISCARDDECPICTAVWCEEAEAMMDARTPDMTWGDLISRLERAVGWRAKSPQVLIVHQRRHRSFTAALPKWEEDDHAS